MSLYGLVPFPFLVQQGTHLSSFSYQLDIPLIQPFMHIDRETPRQVSRYQSKNKLILCRKYFLKRKGNVFPTVRSDAEWCGVMWRLPGKNLTCPCQGQIKVLKNI